jgi:hypothetical protein
VETKENCPPKVEPTEIKINSFFRTTKNGKQYTLDNRHVMV